MRFAPPGIKLFAAALLAAGSGMLADRAAGSDPAPGQPEQLEQLEPISVIAPVAPLDRSLYLLRIMVEQSTPCLGCDAVLRERPRPWPDLLGYLLLQSPPEVDEASRIAREIKLRDSPDLDYLRR